jgi:hypothetical protein
MKLRKNQKGLYAAEKVAVAEAVVHAVIPAGMAAVEVVAEVEAAVVVVAAEEAAGTSGLIQKQPMQSPKQ